MKPNVSIIAAIQSKDGAIGKDGKLLVAISDDLKRFKRLTLGHPIIMGRKTFESIGRVLPGRSNYIITRNPEYKVEGAIVCTSIESAIETAWQEELGSKNDKKEIFLIGGGEIYKQGLPFTSKIYFTSIVSNLEGDTFFPHAPDFSVITAREDRFDPQTGLEYYWIDLERQKSAG